MRTALGCALLGVSALAQEQPATRTPKVQPAALDVGTLHAGALAEASFGVFWRDPAKSKLQATVEVPAGVRLRNATTSSYADKDALTVVHVALDTRQPGELTGEIVVRTCWACCGGGRRRRRRQRRGAATPVPAVQCQCNRWRGIAFATRLSLLRHANQASAPVAAPPR